MKFYYNIKESGLEYPHFRLASDNWDDYSHKTLFSLWFYKSRTDNIRIGQIKIMHKDALTTREVIPQSFEFLDEALYCSLGQDLEFYSNLKINFPDRYQEILNSLNDAATNHGNIEEFENTSGFKSSLLRWSEAEKAYHQA